MASTRIAELQRRLDASELDAALFYKPINTYYLTGFTSLDSTRPTSYTRPIAAVIDRNGATLVVPELGLEAAREICWIDDIRAYPGTPPFEEAQKLLVERILESEPAPAAIGIEADYLPVKFLDDLKRRLPNARFENAAGLVEKMRLHKDSDEIAFLRRSAQISDVAVRASIDNVAPGRSELEVEARGNYAVFTDSVDGTAASIDTISIILGGPHSSMPHEFTSGRSFERGDVMWHCWLTSYKGYWVENIRTGIVGPASPRQQRVAAVIEEALQRGCEAVRPGTMARDVYQAVYEVLKAGRIEEGLIFSRSGHGTGLEYHEPPFFEPNDETILEPGMAVTVEPGIFIPGYGGFTLSDTLIVTETGHDVLTTYPLHLAEVDNAQAS